MSWPSTFLLATVKMLLLCSLLLTASESKKGPRSAVRGPGAQVRGSVHPAGGRGRAQSPTRVEGAVSDLELGFVFIGNVLPRGQEHLPVWGVGAGQTEVGSQSTSALLTDIQQEVGLLAMPTGSQRHSPR